METPNRYIQAMEIGLAHEENGISYFDLIEKLQNKLGYTFSIQAEVTFFKWFSDNFFTSGVEIRNDTYLKAFIYFKNSMFDSRLYGDLAKQLGSNLERQFFLDGDAARHYLEYVELLEAREFAKKSIQKANISIWIAIIAMLFTLGFSLRDVFIPSNETSKSVNVVDESQTTQHEEINLILNDTLVNDSTKVD